VALKRAAGARFAPILHGASDSIRNLVFVLVRVVPVASPLTAVKWPLRLGLRRIFKRRFLFADNRGRRHRMAIKEPYVLELTEELEGDDARRLVEYVREPNPPEGHDEYLDRCDETFDAIYKPQTANDLFY
jgi:hypothetical protein